MIDLYIYVYAHIYIYSPLKKKVKKCTPLKFVYILLLYDNMKGQL